MEVLDLSGNELTEFPPELSVFVCQRLDLTRNAFQLPPQAVVDEGHFRPFASDSPHPTHHILTTPDPSYPTHRTQPITSDHLTSSPSPPTHHIRPVTSDLLHSTLYIRPITSHPTTSSTQPSLTTFHPTNATHITSDPSPTHHIQPITLQPITSDPLCSVHHIRPITSDPKA